MYLFRVMVQVTHMKDTQLPLDCGGAFVGVYIRAKSIREAIDISEAELLDDKYKPIRTYEAVEIDVEDLTDKNEEYASEGDPNSSDLIDIYNNGGLWYAAFNTYPTEEEQWQ